MKTYTTLCSLAVLLLLSTTLAPSATAQDLQYTSTTKFELAGTAGRAMNFLSRLGGGNSSDETVSISGKHMRTDSDNSSTIIDLESGRFIMLDHDNRMYTVMNFSEMTEMAEQMSAQAETMLEEAQAEAPTTDNGRSLEEASAEIDYDVQVNRTGETRTIRGHRAERVLMTLSARGRTTPEAEGEEAVEGALVLANEVWLTTDPSGELQPLFDFQEEMASTMMSEFAEFSSQAQAMGEGLQSAFAADPRMGEMMKEASEELSKMEGVPLVSVMKLVAVPGTMDFNARMAFEGEEPKEEVSTTRRAGRLARGILSNRLGRGNDNDEPEEEAAEVEPRQSTLMTMTTEVSDVQRTSLSNDLFTIPEGYSERNIMGMFE